MARLLAAAALTLAAPAAAAHPPEIGPVENAEIGLRFADCLAKTYRTRVVDMLEQVPASVFSTR